MPVADEDDDSLAAGVRYLTQHPVESARLALARVVRSLTAVRPYFSTVHNWAIIAYLTAIYTLGIFGSSRVWRQPLFGLTAAVVLAHLAIVAATFADFDGQFLLYVLPLMIALAGLGVSHIVPSRWIPVSRA